MHQSKQLHLAHTVNPREQQMIQVPYKSKKAMKLEVGKQLRYTETATHGQEYTPNGTFAVAHRPSVDFGDGGREFFAQVTMVDGMIVAVS